MDGQNNEMNAEMEMKVREGDDVEDMDKAVSTEEYPEQEGIIERPYELRMLKDKDLFPLLKILKKIGIKDFKDAFIQSWSDKQAVNVEKAEDTVKNVGILTAFDIADILLGNLEKAEKEIYSLWSDISGIPVDEMKEMEFGTLPLMIYDTFSNVRNASFFKVLSKFLS
ncbi:MAG: hypothetical protein HFI51_07950 [Lachnospiraceae bacterium]|jgi:hypothetical protein|nr:hypothetical protein [Lachnospiraceae bacterium]